MDRFPTIGSSVPGDYPRVGAFRSIHAYGFDFKLVANPSNRYSIGDRTTFKRDADGGLTIYVRADDPGGELTSNWLPTAKGKPFLLNTRAARQQAQAPAVLQFGSARRFEKAPCAKSVAVCATCACRACRSDEAAVALYPVNLARKGIGPP